jgi:hypothetical protein
VVEPEGGGEVSGRVGPVDQEAVGSLEDLGVPVGASCGHEDRLSLLQGSAVEVLVLGGGPGGHLDGAVVAQELFDGAGYERGLLREPAPRAGVPEEGDTSPPKGRSPTSMRIVHTTPDTTRLRAAHS